MKQNPSAITLALTGASGAQYGLRLLQCLLLAGRDVALLLSGAAEVVIAAETDVPLPMTKSGASEQEQADFLQHYFTPASANANNAMGRVTVYGKEDWFAPVASGSSAPRAMVICPASGGSMSAVASGASNNLIERAADVALKERRQLILVPREAPYSMIHLENMLKLTQLGAVIIPASPGFYQRPKTIDDLVDFVVARILDQLDIPQTLMPRWGEAL